LHDILKELDFMKKIDNEYIIKFYGYCINKNNLNSGKNFLIIIEFAEKGTLHDYLQSNKKIKIKTKLSFLIGITKGMIYLHDNKIIHRDLKTENILVKFF
jgi:serine/threonine protein kinase